MSRPRLQGRGHPSRPQPRAVTAAPAPALPGQVLAPRRNVSHTMKLAVSPEEEEHNEERHPEPAWEERDDSAWVAYVRSQLAEMYPHFMGTKEETEKTKGTKESEKTNETKDEAEKGDEEDRKRQWEAEAERDAQRDAFVRAQLAAMYPFFAAPSPAPPTSTDPIPIPPPHRPDLAGPGMHALRRFVSGHYPEWTQQRGVSMPMPSPTANTPLPPPLAPHHTGPAAIRSSTPADTTTTDNPGPTEADYEAYLAQYTAYMTAAADAQARAQSQYAFGYPWAYGGYDGEATGDRQVSRVGGPVSTAPPPHHLNTVSAVANSTGLLHTNPSFGSGPDPTPNPTPSPNPNPNPSPAPNPTSAPGLADLLRALNVVRAFDAAMYGPRADAVVFAEDNLAKLRAQGMGR